MRCTVQDRLPHSDGKRKLSPCPVCNKETSTLSALGGIGHCYGNCGKVKLEQLFDLVFAPRDKPGKEAEANDTKLK